MTNPLPSPARADRRQRSQNAADVSPTPSAASPLPKQVGGFLLAVMEKLPVPNDLERQ